MSVLVIGQGAVGRALVAGLTARKIGVRGVRARDTMILTPSWARRSDQGHPAPDLIYAAGPAGEVACRVDPRAAVLYHFEKVEECGIWASGSRRRVILIGTVIESGMYGAMKAVGAGAAMGHMTGPEVKGSVLHLRCGQIIGPEMPVDGTGVVATWIRQAVRGEPLRVTTGAPPLALTICADLIDRIVAWLRAPITAPWEEERLCIPDPIDLSTLSVLCTEAALKQVSVPGPRHWDVRRALDGMAENARQAFGKVNA